MHKFTYGAFMCVIRNINLAQWSFPATPPLRIKVSARLTVWYLRITTFPFVEYEDTYITRVDEYRGFMCSVPTKANGDTSKATAATPTSVTSPPVSVSNPTTSHVETTPIPTPTHTVATTPITTSNPTPSLSISHSESIVTPPTSQVTSNGNSMTSKSDPVKPSTATLTDHSIIVNPPIVTFTLPGSNGVTGPPITLSIPSTASGSAVTTLPNSDVVKDVVVTATAQVSGSDAVVLATVRVTGKPVAQNYISPGNTVHAPQGVLLGIFSAALFWRLL
ncbi:hypothetical protein K493DRAFT_308061 [Basidiobolus meristosporus CBS 931.73]|uniref:Uncharacterized protein n=1 Tax=Basidiobolus meristosporus CBS 931.73 TaxID=1314790 RepID=A0A1Y1X6P4_9FUNG|nr:hypothetical protein K493DRAFT_308061 [Basidiobolus meristosporus CBS 931.73]|eukprot:ORX81460.1 hypothetical protein K493DRAFT_308061 [Basidiobolus meristosporus CBS 931.73]